jgi:predicted NodU family carbamoyl transferase
MLLNTSLNVNTKPIAGYKSNCWDIFHKTAIDSIVIGDYTLQK